MRSVWSQIINVFAAVPCVCVGIAVAEIVHVQTVLLQAARALLDPRQEASPVAPLLTFSVQPPGQRTAICNTTPAATVSRHCCGLISAFAAKATESAHLQ